MDDSLERYILEHIEGENPFMAELRRNTYVNQLRPRMLSGHLQGKILKMLCRMIRPRRVLEIGTYTGYSALSMGEGMEEGTEIHTFEINDELEDFTRSYLERSPYAAKIHFYIGDALRLLPEMDILFDLAFIDGDKRAYCEYFDCVFPKIRKGGYIFADNTLWDGKVTQDVKSNDAQTIGILDFNDKVSRDERIETVILPLRDGLTIMRKK